MKQNYDLRTDWDFLDDEEIDAMYHTLLYALPDHDLVPERYVVSLKAVLRELGRCLAFRTAQQYAQKHKL